MKPLLKRIQDGEIDPSTIITHRSHLMKPIADIASFRIRKINA